MAYTYNLPNATSGIDSVLSQTASSVPAFIPMLLSFVYFLVLIGGFNAQRRKEVNADFSQWNLLAALSTLMITLLLSTGQGLMNGTILSVVVALNILSGIWYFFSRGRFE
jgi:ABC-type multidrug transport system permease subunit